MISDRYRHIWQTVQRYVADTGHHPITLESLCAITGTLPRDVHEICRALTGLTVIAYVRQERLRLAAEQSAAARPVEVVVRDLTPAYKDG